MFIDFDYIQVKILRLRSPLQQAAEILSQSYSYDQYNLMVYLQFQIDFQNQQFIILIYNNLNIIKMSILSNRSISHHLPNQISNNQTLSRQKKREFGSYLHIIQKRQRMLQTSLLPETILADKLQPKRIMIISFKIIILLLICIFILNIGPSPLRIQSQQDIIYDCKDNFTCIQNNNIQMQTRKIITRHISPLNRKLKVYIQINSKQIQKNPVQYQKIPFLTLQEQIKSIQIHGAREGQAFGDVITQISGQQIIEDILFERPMFFVGDVHELNEPSYQIKIIRRINQKRKENRRLQQDQEFTNNQTISQNQNATNSQNKNNNTKNQSTLPVIPKYRKYHPLIIWVVTRSIYYSIVQLLVRYISLLLIIYVITQTPFSPKLLAFIMIVYCNPLVFLQIASPNQFSTIITAISNSAYLGFLIIYIYYCHQKYSSPLTNALILILKETIVVILILMNILRLQHFYQGLQIWFIQCILFIFIIVFLWGYLWQIFVYYRQQLHRDILTVTTSLWYLSVVFTAGFIVTYGWYDLIKYMVVQIYAVKITYFTDKYQINRKWQILMRKQQLKSNDKSKLKKIKLKQGKQEADQIKFPSDQNNEHLDVHQQHSDDPQMERSKLKQNSSQHCYYSQQIMYVDVFQRKVILKQPLKQNLDFQQSHQTDGFNKPQSENCLIQHSKEFIDKQKIVIKSDKQQNNYINKEQSKSQ